MKKTYKHGLAILFFSLSMAQAAHSGDAQKFAVSLTLHADQAISATVNECMKRQFSQSPKWFLSNLKPARSVILTARQSMIPGDEEQIVMSMVVLKVFDNDAAIKHWVSGFRRAFEYDALVALKRATSGLVKFQTQVLGITTLKKLDIQCKALIEAIP